MKQINKKYEHLKVEQDKNQFWYSNNLFEPKDSNKFFSIVLPPPNVTGHLHLGHAWDVSYQDVLIRYKRLNGYSALWLPGTDHAGIATQTKFDRILFETTGKRKDDLGKEKFLSELWNWKQSQADFIHSQWAKMGLSLSYKNEKFTMDEDVNLAVRKVFVELYKKGLIYQDKKIVNWDPQLKTAISNIEVIYKETSSKMYYFKYFTENKKDFVIVATTRPETMFGDVCLVAHPTDERYLKFKGQKFINPANDELLDLVFDDYIEKDFGTGIMKCTPAHDFNDNEIAKRHHLKVINIFNEDATLNELGNKYKNMDRFECREKLVSDLKQKGLLEKIETITNNVGYSERTNVVVEPYMSNQWFVSMDKLAKKVREIQSSTKNKVNFVPERFNKTLLNWLENIEDWCISRQLWWGHQIPIWYHKKTNEIYCEINPPKDIENWVQDESVLDTWFSSGLWPMVTMNWPDTKNPIFKNYFPSDVLVTGYDIIFFWVSRMMMLTEEFTDTIPFKNVLIHGLIRDEQGRKMSKSLGNGVDPMDVIDEYGCDSLRLFLTATSSLGEDLLFSPTKIAHYWNFINKLWNGFRFIYDLIEKHEWKINLKLDPKKLDVVDKAILDKLNSVIEKVSKCYEQFNFVVGTKYLVDFIWDEFNNNYLELCKIKIKNNDLECLNVLSYVLKQSIILLHPQAPFVTEEIYSHMFKTKDQISIMNETWPSVLSIKDFDKQAYHNFSLISELIKKIRLEHQLKFSDQIHITAFDTVNNKEVNTGIFCNYYEAWNTSFKEIKDKDTQVINYFLDNIKLNFYKAINKQDLLDGLLKQQKTIEFEYNRAYNMLQNQNFVAKASADKIQSEKDKLEKYKTQLDEINEQIKNLK